MRSAVSSLAVRRTIGMSLVRAEARRFWTEIRGRPCRASECH